MTPEQTRNLKMIIRAISILLLSFAANAQAPLYQQTIVETGDLRQGDVVAAMGMSNWNQVFSAVSYPGVTVVNSACGGCVVGTWARGAQTYKDKPLWSAVPSNTTIVWVNPVNRARTDLNTYVSQTTADTVKLLGLIKDRLPNVREVWLTGLHGEPFAPLDSKQPNAYAYQSGVIADNVAKNPPAGLPFVVRHAAYIYAETTPRNDGLFYSRSDFGNDALHLSDAGIVKVSTEMKAYMANAIGGTDPVPDPAPNSCLDRVANNDSNCRVNWQGTCQCRN